MSKKYEIDPVSVFSSIVCTMTKLDGSQVSDRCPLGYLFHDVTIYRNESRAK